MSIAIAGRSEIIKLNIKKEQNMWIFCYKRLIRFI